MHLFTECVQWATFQDAEDTAVNKIGKKNPWNNGVYISEGGGK